MNHSTAELDQTDEDFFCEVSDETLEAAAGTPIGGQAMVTVGPTILIGVLLTWEARAPACGIAERRPRSLHTSSPATRQGGSPPTSHKLF